MTTQKTTDESSGRQTSATSSPAGNGDDAPTARQSAELKPAPPQEAAIHCQHCRRINASNARKCAHCGVDLLPGASLVQRVGILAACCLLAAASFYFFISNLNKTEPGGKRAIFLVGLLIFGILMLGYGIIQSLRKIPLDERYVTRAKRHASLNKLQAIADYGSAMQTAPQHLVLNYLGERAKLCQELGMAEQAGDDWRHALVMINERIARANPPAPDLFKQRAELYQNLNMQDEYALEMLLYSIEKEKTFKTKESDIAEDWQEGLTKGREDVKRQEFQKLRAGILQDPKYRIIGQCKKCHATVDLDHKLHCTKGAKHRVKDIRPVLRKTDPS